MNCLEQLKQYTTVVADTGDFHSILKYKPQDATTNPSLLYSASSLPQYKNLVEDAINYGKENGKNRNEKISMAMDKLAVNFGIEILKIVPGRVSTEIDARLSFDTEGTIKKAKDIISLYNSIGIDRNRILLKIASTWEGIQAAKQLEKEGIHCNLTLLFSLIQAATCAEAKVTLISPFVGRITDYYKQRDKKESYLPHEDPGVLSVKTIFNYFKYHGYKTIIMGASFRNKDQIIELAGCDYLTISPQLLEELTLSNMKIERKLDPHHPKEIPKLNTDEKNFRWLLNEDEMANFKLSEGIRKFSGDIIKLENIIQKSIE